MPTINKIDGYEIYKWDLGFSSYEVNIACGARLMKWTLQLAGGKKREVIFWDEKAPKGGFDESFSEARGGNPILFPFAGNSFVGAEKNIWKTPDGEILPMHSHGYASMGNFELVSVSERGFKARYIPNNEAKNSYPYDYDFFVEYSFEELSLSCKLTLVNKSQKRIPWGAGTHFYFTMPWHDGCSRNNYRILHDAKLATSITKDGIVSPASLAENSFGSPSILNRVLSKFKSGIVKFGLNSGEEDVSIIIDGGSKPRAGVCVVTWTESENSPYYCVEPWLSPPKSSGSPKHFVEIGESSEFVVKVSLE